MNGLVRLSLLIAFWVAITYATTSRTDAQITSLPGLVSKQIIGRINFFLTNNLFQQSLSPQTLTNILVTSPYKEPLRTFSTGLSPLKTTHPLTHYSSGSKVVQVVLVLEMVFSLNMVHSNHKF